MTNEPQHAAGSHPVGAGDDARLTAPDASGTDPETGAPGAATRGAGEEAAGWSGNEVVRDHSGQAAGESGWESEGVVRDQGENDDPGADTGWSGSEVVRDQGEVPTADAGGWSADEVVKDHGEDTAG